MQQSSSTNQTSAPKMFSEFFGQPSVELMDESGTRCNWQFGGHFLYQKHAVFCSNHVKKARFFRRTSWHL